MKKYLFVLLVLPMMLPLACKKEHIQEELTVWVIWNNIQSPSWGYGAEEVFNKKRIIDFFKDKGIEILEVKIGSEMPGGHHTGAPPTTVYCRIYEKDLAVMQENKFDFYRNN